ncbi:2-succinyl-5-enolpyruvyl-6-hydroxy-3-cyclohexene-1-carboxylic-acid synthase [Flavobacterium proteolyticum]|uniref:2-succinyl-5-enolpyruvyl-6-hydroxy-3-cyclohexene-1-carboxylate synthase n=1 Tax=Flavobacterium proteolyticum TaxID=2911683 RepID=A0ABR9WTW3_9FLAO|nr:2-succinyl-5-enolpyruvyl-6-hydroxy-3-cyclohexene-1-carboxylic-acid synthase [Flavobacterium proteolyticum]MBE9577093.1 2-succinyl-5-enolpyruvyl-6-hydroxy-3-cyclohexene-1-carboxylic-acid synthase [Flavobacterium proteolyticum]
MMYPKIPLAQSIIEICQQKGVQHIVISPGSRNAPLTIGFTNNPYFKCYSIADERCAAFFALGIAQQIQKPVAVVCTSGSAVLNYYPAVAEAFYSQIPLVVISADRPQNKIDIGDGQTIRQENVFANHSLYNANLQENVSTENDNNIQMALHVAVTQKGPVHINAPFEEPLYENVSELQVKPEIIDFNTESKTFSLGNSTVETWNKATKKLVLVGELFPNSVEQKYLDALANDPSVVVLTEKTSNLHHPTFIDQIDTLITPFTDEDFKAFQPEILLTFGGMVVSKRIKAFLRKYKPAHHWHVDELRAYDTFGALTNHFETTTNTFLSQLLTEEMIKSSYKSSIATIWKDRVARHKEYTAKIPFSDFKVFDFICQNLPKNSQLQVSNSSAIRYLQLFDLDKTVQVFCNRGTSGIDGSTSTAIGAALASDLPTILITGDISFLYDSNALWNNYIPKNFKIILLNNSGGGIFRILPGHQETETFNTYFETSHQLNASHLAKMYGFDYFEANNETTLQQQYSAFLNQNEKPSILEVFTPEKENNGILLEFFRGLK